MKENVSGCFFLNTVYTELSVKQQTLPRIAKSSTKNRSRQSMSMMGDIDWKIWRMNLHTILHT